MGQRWTSLLLALAVVALSALASRYLPGPPPMPTTVRSVVGNGRWQLDVAEGRVWIRAKGDPAEVVWSEPCGDASNVQGAWSDDGTWLALLQMDAGPHLTVWRYGWSRRYQGEFLNGEGAMDMLFSPNHLDLLLRIAPSFGNYDVDLGKLFSLNLGSGSIQFLAESVRRVRFTGPNRFLYWQCQVDPTQDPSSWPLLPRSGVLLH